MKRHLKTTLLFALALSATLATAVTGAHGDALSPTGTLAIGDWWKYDFQVNNFRSPPVTLPLVGTVSFTANLTGVIIETLVREQSVTVNGASSDSYRLDLSGSGILLGTVAERSLTGTWTTAGSNYELKADLSEISASATVQVSAQVSGFSLHVTITSSTGISPPEQTYKFPLAIGQSWTTVGTTSTNLTLSTPFSSKPNSTLIRATLQETHSVASSQISSVPAGAYQTFLVEARNSSGSHFDNYYSPQVESSVKGIQYDATGYPILTMTLRDYSAWPFKSGLNIDRNSQAYGVLISTDVANSNARSDAVSISFQVSGPDGVTGRAKISMPKQLNITDVKATIDGSPTTTTISQNTTHYQVLMTFPLSTHTVSLTYSSPNSPASPLAGILLTVSIAAGVIIAVAVLVTVLVIRRRKPTGP